MENLLLFRRDERLSRVLSARIISCAFVFFYLFVCKISASRYERRGDFSIKDGKDEDA